MYLYYTQYDKTKRTNIDRNRPDSDFSIYQVKDLLSDYNQQKKLGLSKSTIDKLQINRSEQGKPYFPQLLEGQETSEPVYFSVSHSGNWWSCLFADTEVGFDLEVFKEKIKYLELARRFYSGDEYQYVLDYGLEAFFDIWVCKEAYIKYKGSGISEGLATFTVVRNGQITDGVDRLLPENIRNDAYLKRIITEKDIKMAYCTKKLKTIEKINRM